MDADDPNVNSLRLAGPRDLGVKWQITQILYFKYIKYERISLRRWKYSNYAPNTPQWQRSACQCQGQQTKKQGRKSEIW